MVCGIHNVIINNFNVHDTTHSSREEAYLLKSTRSVFALPIYCKILG